MSKILTITMSDECFKQLEHEIKVKCMLDQLYIKESMIDKLSAIFIRAIDKNMKSVNIIDPEKDKPLGSKVN